MLATFAEALDAIAKVPKETWSSVGTGIGLLVLAVLGTIASRKGAADKAAQPVNPVQPVGTPSGGFTFLADAETERSILDELRHIRANQETYHAEQERRRELAERRELVDENQDLKAELEILRAGQQKTHGNQGDIVARTETIETKLDALMRKLDIH